MTINQNWILAGVLVVVGIVIALVVGPLSLIPAQSLIMFIMGLLTYRLAKDQKSKTLGKRGMLIGSASLLVFLIVITSIMLFNNGFGIHGGLITTPAVPIEGNERY